MDLVALLWTVVLVGVPLAAILVVGRLTWALASRSGIRLAVAPVLAAAGVTALGVVLMAVAPPGLEGLGHTLVGFYVAAAGGIATLVAAGVVIVARGRLSRVPPRRGRSRPGR